MAGNSDPNNLIKEHPIQREDTPFQEKLILGPEPTEVKDNSLVYSNTPMKLSNLHLPNKNQTSKPSLLADKKYLGENLASKNRLPNKTNISIQKGHKPAENNVPDQVSTEPQDIQSLIEEMPK